MTTDRIKEIQEKTAYPNSRSVQQALLQVWNECEQNIYDLYSEVPIAGTNATITKNTKMKSKEEIEGLAIEHAHLKPNFDRVEEEYYNIGAINAYESFIRGYTQCQEDMAIEIAELKIICQEYSKDVKALNDMLNSLNKQD